MLSFNFDYDLLTIAYVIVMFPCNIRLGGAATAAKMQHGYFNNQGPCENADKAHDRLRTYTTPLQNSRWLRMVKKSMERTK